MAHGAARGALRRLPTRRALPLDRTHRTRTSCQPVPPPDGNTTHHRFEREREGVSLPPSFLLVGVFLPSHSPCCCCPLSSKVTTAAAAARSSSRRGQGLYTPPVRGRSSSAAWSDRAHPRARPPPAVPRTERAVSTAAAPPAAVADAAYAPGAAAPANSNSNSGDPSGSAPPPSHHPSLSDDGADDGRPEKGCTIPSRRKAAGGTAVTMVGIDASGGS
eukprot:gene20354-41708_t